jgi:hypothetical protein
VLHHYDAVAEAVWLCGIAALLSLDRQSNEDKRQCKAGGEGIRAVRGVASSV